jgi:small subunit ribosomal protein S20e
MADVVKKGGESQQHKIRITLWSRQPGPIEKVMSDLVARAKETSSKGDAANAIKIRGPVRLPTRTLHHVTRASPCGNGSNTWDRYEMQIYKRLVDFYAPQEAVKQLTSVNLEPGVDIEVTVMEA